MMIITNSQLFVIIIIIVLGFLLYINTFDNDFNKYKLVRNYDNYLYNIINVKQCPKYLINLDRRKDRLITTGNLLQKYGYTNIMKYPAVDGLKITNTTLKQLVHEDSIDPIYKKKRTRHHELSIGAVGCYLSHVGLWNIIENDKNYEYAIIFEDDTNPTINQEDLDIILSSAPKDWDIIIFGGYYNIKKNFDYRSNNFYKINKFFCLHAYIINKKAINKIKPYLYPIKIQIDWVLSNMSSEDKLNIYAIKGSKWYQNTQVNSTDIQTPLVF